MELYWIEVFLFFLMCSFVRMGYVYIELILLYNNLVYNFNNYLLFCFCVCVLKEWKMYNKMFKQMLIGEGILNTIL